MICISYGKLQITTINSLNSVAGGPAFPGFLCFTTVRVPYCLRRSAFCLLRFGVKGGIRITPMPKGLRRFHVSGDRHFITCSCYRRQQFLGSARRRNLFLKILGQVRQQYDTLAQTTARPWGSRKG